MTAHSEKSRTRTQSLLLMSLLPLGAPAHWPCPNDNHRTRLEMPRFLATPRHACHQKFFLLDHAVGQASSSKRNQCRFPGRLAPTTAQAIAPTSRSRNWPAMRRTWPRLSAGTRTPWRDARRKCDDAAANRRPVLPGQARKRLGPAMRRRSGRCVERTLDGVQESAGSHGTACKTSNLNSPRKPGWKRRPQRRQDWAPKVSVQDCPARTALSATPARHRHCGIM